MIKVLGLKIRGASSRSKSLSTLGKDVCLLNSSVSPSIFNDSRTLVPPLYFFLCFFTTLNSTQPLLWAPLSASAHYPLYTIQTIYTVHGNTHQLYFIHPLFFFFAFLSVLRSLNLWYLRQNSSVICTTRRIFTRSKSQKQRPDFRASPTQLKKTFALST